MSTAADCSICGKPVAPERAMRGFAAWVDGQGDTVDRETLPVVVHKSCYLEATPDQRDRLLDDAEAS